MPLALWTLLWLNARAVVRRLTRRLRTPRGAVLSVVGLAVMGLYLGRLVLFNGFGPRADPAVIRVVGPVAVLLICVLNVVSSAGERAVTFAPAEVDFLFPGPFTRRQLLAYKLIKTGLAGVVSAVFLGFALGRYGGSFLGRWVAAWLTFQFVQMVAMAAALIQSTVGERTFARGKQWVGVVALGLAVAVVAPAAWRQRNVGLAPLAGHLRASAAGRVVLAPFGVFVRALVAPRLVDGLGWDAIGAAMVAGLIVVVVRLDANYLETAAAASGRRYARVGRMRQAGLAGMASAKSANLRLGMLPWMGGVGPVAWRQLTTVLRTSRNLLAVLAVVAVAAGGAISRSESTAGSIGTLVGLSLWANLFLTALLKFDFRGDLDQIDNLRSLPLSPAAVAAAEVVAPTVVLSAVQWLLLAAVAAFGHVGVRWLLAAAVFVVPVNAALVGSENLVFLLFPYRPPAAVAGDMGMIGRQSVVFLCRFLTLLMVAVAATVVGAVGFMLTGGRLVASGHRGGDVLTGGSWPVAGTLAWLTVVAAVIGTVLLMGLAFARLDPAADAAA